MSVPSHQGTPHPQPSPPGGARGESMWSYYLEVVRSQRVRDSNHTHAFLEVVGEL